MRKMSIKHRLFFCYSSLVIVMIVFTTIVSQKLIDKVFQEKMLENHRREMALITNTLESDLQHMQDYLMSVAQNPQVISLMKDHPFLTTEMTEYNDIRRKLGKEVYSIVGMNESIFQWDIVTLGNQFLFVSGGGFLGFMEKKLGPDYFSMTNKDRTAMLKGPYMIEVPWETGRIFPVFVMSKQIVNPDTLDNLGYVAFIIEEAAFASVFENNIPADIKAEYFLLSEDNTILSASEKEMIGQDFIEERKLSEKEWKNFIKQNTCITDHGGTSILYTRFEIKDNGWMMVYATPVEELMASQYYARWIVGIIGIAACVTALIIAGFLAHHITNPIVVLSRKMSAYYAEDQKDVVIFHSDNEIENLFTGFEELIKNAEQLMDQIYNEQEEKSNIRFQLIQSQIKPHFLYNTLETVKSLVDLEMYEEASGALTALSKFYRMSLNTGNDIISIAKEIELSEQYMYIQKLRYMEYLDYEFPEYDGLKEYIMPKLTLQPILENAIYHGIRQRQDAGKILLQIEEKEDRLIFVIEDNGVGIDEKRLEELNDDLNSGDKKNVKSFGLYSVNRKIQLFFGNGYGLSVESSEEEYTRVYLSIPKVTE